MKKSFKYFLLYSMFDLTLKDDLITLLPPNFDNEYIDFNNMKLTYLIKKVELKDRIKLLLKRFTRKDIVISERIKYFFNSLTKTKNIKLYEKTSFPKNLISVIIYTPSAEDETKIFFKVYIANSIYYVSVYYDRNKEFDNYFIYNFN